MDQLPLFYTSLTFNSELNELYISSTKLSEQVLPDLKKSALMRNNEIYVVGKHRNVTFIFSHVDGNGDRIYVQSYIYNDIDKDLQLRIGVCK